MAHRGVVSVDRFIDVAPQVVFDVIADPKQHPVFDGSGTVRASATSGRLHLGVRFRMSMRNRLSYPAAPRVTEFDEGRRIAWRNPLGATWRYELEPIGSGTRVVETFDLTTAVYGFVLARTRVPDRVRADMARTLERLDRLVSGRADR